MKKYVYVEGYDPQTEAMFEERGYEMTNRVIDADLVVLTGGPDIHPGFYEQEVNGSRGIDLDRDQQTFAIISLAYWLDKPLIGICRGAQALTVYFGGSLIQHIDGHTLSKQVVTVDGAEYQLVEDHHQAMVPDMDGDDVPVVYRSYDDIAEIVFWEDYNALAFQAHPEWTDPENDTQKLFWKFVEKLEVR